MNRTIKELLDRHEKDLERINNQRRLWLWASSVVVIGLIFLIFGWDWLSDLHSKSLWWVIISLMLVISINWWYWTMRVIRIIIKYQEVEYSILKTIITDIHRLKKDLKTFHDQTIDILK